MSVDPAALCAAVAAGDRDSMTQLYEAYRRGVSYLLARNGVRSGDLADQIHEVFVTVFSVLRRGEMREPEYLLGFIRTITRRTAARYVNGLVDARRHEPYEIKELVNEKKDGRSFGYSKEILATRCHKATPEEVLAMEERRKLAHAALMKLAPADREILIRFYVQEQSPDQIQREMGLTDTTFRLHKSRAKSRFGAMGGKLLKPQRKRLLAKTT